MKALSRLKGLGALMVIAALPGMAATFNLQDLIDNNTVITVGDKEFFDFDLLAVTTNCPSIVGCSSFINLTADANVITVGTVESMLPTSPGIVFSGPLVLDNTQGTTNAFLDILLTYSVRQVNGLPLIGSITNAFTGGGQNGNVSISEVATSITPVAGLTANSNLSLNLNDFSDPPAEALDTLVFSQPVSSVRVEKDIFFSAIVGGFVDATGITQKVNQVPEPSALLLMGTALLGLGYIRKRARK